MNFEQIKQFGDEYIHYDFWFWALNTVTLLSVFAAAVVFIREICPKIKADNPPRERVQGNVDVLSIMGGLALFCLLPFYIVGLIVIFVLYEVIR